MREDLLGYLLSALEPHEMRQVDQQLQDDPRLREELAEVERMLYPLDQSLAVEHVISVPPSLIAQTLERIPSRHGAPAQAAQNEWLPEASLTIGSAPETLPRGRRPWMDLLAGCAAAAVLLALALPTVARLRSEARNVACQDNLRQLGAAISQFVLRERDAYLPSLAESGPEAFAGMYAVRLADRGLLADARLRWCPELPLPQDEPPPSRRFKSVADDPPPAALTHLVIGEELKQAADRGDVSLLRWLQRIAGGHYAYSLGVVDGNRYDAPQYEGRSSFAILGDAPISGTHGTDSVDVTKLRWSHGGEGANLLYEDGSVRHLRVSAMLELPDHPFVNHRGSIEAGVNIDDASLAPSWRPPFIQVRQR